MTKFRLAILLAGISAILSASAMAQRETTDLPDGWKFIKQDAAVDAAYDSWDVVTVPHTWNAKDGQEYNNDKENGNGKKYYRGPGWYAKELDIPATWKDKRIFIRFEAASLVADVYINGQHLGQHRGGFAAFCYELTDYIKPDGKNVLRVKVDNTRFNDIAPLSGDFTVFGGLYRPVHLIATSQTCISPLEFASPGVYLQQMSVTPQQAVVRVSVATSNHETGDAPKTQVDLLDADKKVVQTTSVDDNSVVTLTIPNPHLWNGRKDPYLYQVQVKLVRDGKVIDEVDQNLGLRTVAITQDKGFLLNGQPYNLHGVNRHQEVMDKGWAISNADHDRDMQLIMDVGATVTRLAHYQQSNYFHDLADHNGMILWQEVPLVNQIYDTHAFDENAKQQLTEMILQGYNHPSLCMWGIYNELNASWIKDREDPPEALLTMLRDTAHALDPSRPVVAASQDVGVMPMHSVPDWQGYNIYPGWYAGWGKAEDFGKVVDKAVKNLNGKRIAISEYGAGANTTHHEEGPPSQPPEGGQFHPEEWQAYVHECAWKQAKDNPHLWGTFVWAMFDFAVAGRNEGGQPGTNDKGLVNHDRSIKKDSYFFYQANWTDKPMVYISSRRNTERKMAKTPIKIYSNCKTVELKVNGKTIPAVKGNDIHIFLWPEVALQPGKNTIEVTGKSGTEQVSDTCEWNLAQ